MKNNRLEEAQVLQKKIQKFTRMMVSSGALGPKECLNMMNIP
ncbi:unnamed protein product, partial [marine sediment metagenome]